MKHIIIGTAGHIDHGKTTLIRALTGRNTDRLKEEQKRGISIELGFTFFDLPSGLRAGIIDVPGHEKFIRNMLAGVAGLDMVMLVIAADEGMMPQSREHLAIMQLLGIKSGFVVLTKSDLVEEDWLDLVEEEVREELEGSFLEDAPILRVASTKGEGIDQIKAQIDGIAATMQEQDTADIPRLPVDRSFTISGFGTVVTGTLISGELENGSEVQLYPSDKTARIRSIQVHDQEEKTAYKGQRVALNLAGIKKEDAPRGTMIASVGSMIPTQILDAQIHSIDLPFDLANRTRLRLYIGSAEVFCRMILLDRDILESNDTCVAQLKLEEPIVTRKGDRFILRLFSPMITVGGGEILDANPGKRKRYDEEQIQLLEAMVDGDSLVVTEQVIREHSKEFPKASDIAAYRGRSLDNIIIEVEQLEEQGKLIAVNQMRDVYLVHMQPFMDLKTRIEEEVRNYHKKYPLRMGMSKEEIRSKYFGKTNKKVGDLFLDALIDLSKLEVKNEYLRAQDFSIGYTPKQEQIKEKILAAHREDQLIGERLEEVFQNDKIDRHEITEVLNALLASGELIRLEEDIILRKAAFESALLRLRGFLEENGQITISEARDLLNANRRISLALLEYMDKRGITQRLDDIRKLV